MLGAPVGRQDRLFYEFDLEAVVPADHLLRRIDAAMDLSWLRGEMRPHYSHLGCPSVCPELMVRMLLIGYCYSIRSERRLCEEVKVNLAYRWFCRLGLKDKVPHHSTFSVNRHGRFRDSDILRKVFEEAVCGCMHFEETSAGNFDVTGEQTLEFVIDVTVTSVNARVVITTNSVTKFTGTGSGALPGSITMNPLTAPFNVNAAATGNVNCQATNTSSGADVSAAVCPLANLQGGDNSVPLPGDPGMRTFPPLTTGADTFELGSGPADPTGWYLSNPAPLGGNGTQWVALAGAPLEDGGGGTGGTGGTGGGAGGAGGAGGGG